MSTRTYRRIEKAEPALMEYLARHADRMDEQAPSAVWVCEDAGAILGALLVYPFPHLRVSLVLEPGIGFMVPFRLAEAFEAWARRHQINTYRIVVSAADDKFCRILERWGALLSHSGNEWNEYVHTIRRPVLESGVRSWDARDWRRLRQLVRDYLRSLLADGGNILPTRRNVETIVRMGVRGAAAGDPCVVSVRNSRVIGFCLWTGMPTVLDVKDRICTGWGTYVSPDYRREGWSVRMRERAIQLAKDAKYDTVEGIALSPIGLAAARQVGFTPRGAAVSLRI